MNSKKFFKIYTVMWLLIVVILFFFLGKISNDEQLINEAGLIRGTVQKIIVSELYNTPDDASIAQVDDLLYTLKSEYSKYGIMQNKNQNFTQKLGDVEIIWLEIKEQLVIYRENASNETVLFELSDEHFKLADELTTYIEERSHTELTKFSILFLLCFLFVTFILTYSYFQNKHSILDTIERDPLTGLMTRAGFFKIAQNMLNKNPTEKFKVVIFDVKKFKLLNNKYGYEIGDLILAEIGKNILDWKNEDTFCSRTNADVFVLISKSSYDILASLRRLLSDTVNNFHAQRYFGEINFAYGIYEFEDTTEPLNLILDKARLALQEAKKDLISSVVVYDDTLFVTLKKEQFYNENIQAALEKNEIQLFLQPQIDVRTMQLYGAESLIRWRLSSGKLAFPDEFIPIFERNGWIYRVDLYMLKQTCQYLRKIPQKYEDFIIAINFSRHSICSPNFYNDFLKIVDDYHVNYSQIKIEVTETSLNNVGDMAIKVLYRLRNKGFKIAMDDFGAGYSSLSFLSKLPMDTLKLDRQFLWGIDENDRMKDIIESTVSMAHKIGILVTCEGVEMQEHLDFIKSVGCDYAQGYFFSKPISSDDFFEKYLRD